MPEGESSTRSIKLFIGCFTFSADLDVATTEVDDGSFQILVEAEDADEAAARCRARLWEMETTTGSLGPVLVFANAFIEVDPSDLGGGLVINHQALGPEVSYCFLPPQGTVASVEHPLDEAQPLADLAERAGLGLETDDEIGDDPLVPIFWGKWKLYWCETPDHDEDWFIVARSADEAAAFHEDAEGYDVGEADAELVCVLPDALQRDADRERGGWPSDRALLACGAELVPHTPRDEDADLREQLGSRARVVRINGRVYGEGDLVSNVRHRLGAEPDA